MNTTTTAHATTATTTSAAHRFRRRIVGLFAATLASALVLALPAGALEPLEIEVKEVLPPPADPEVAVQGSGHCDPEGFSYEAVIVVGLGNRPYTVKVEWSEVDGAGGGTENGQSGFVPAAEGSYEMVATVNYPQVHTEDMVFAAVTATSPPSVVTVHCPDDEPKGNPGGGPEVKSDIVQANPNFTG